MREEEKNALGICIVVSTRRALCVRSCMRACVRAGLSRTLGVFYAHHIVKYHIVRRALIEQRIACQSCRDQIRRFGAFRGLEWTLPIKLKEGQSTMSHVRCTIVVKLDGIRCLPKLSTDPQKQLRSQGK